MAKLTFNTDLCKGCGLCVDACPKGCLAIAEDKLNPKGYSPAFMKEDNYGNKVIYIPTALPVGKACRFHNPEQY
mgnify:CR=1 FL=1